MEKLGIFFHFSALYRSIIWCWHLLPVTITLRCLSAHVQQFEAYSRNVKKCRRKTEGAMKISASRASKRAPTWHSCTITPKSLSGQPLDQVWIRSGLGWPERYFGVDGWVMSCRGSFRSSWCADFHGTLSFAMYFLCPCHWFDCLSPSKFKRHLTKYKVSGLGL